MFLALQILHPNKFLVPCYAIDIVWHTHQVRRLSRTSANRLTINVPLFKKLVIGNFMYLSAVVYCCCVLLSVVGCSCVLLCVRGVRRSPCIAVLCEQVFRGRGLAGRSPPPPPTIV